MKTAIRSALAEADIDAAVDYYCFEAPHIVIAFIDALEAAIRHIETLPASGSPRFGQELDIPKLRHWPIRGFPYAVFYLEQPDHLKVIRVVHMGRDLPAGLAGLD